MSPQAQSRAGEAMESPVAGLEQLSRERQPSRDLWAGIESRIAKPTVRRRDPSLWPYGLAASICIALLAGVLLRAQPSLSGPTVPVAAIVPGQPAARADGSHPYSNHDEPSRGLAALSPRTLRMLRSESLDNAPALVAERAEASGLMKATYSGHEGRNAHGQQAILRANLRLVSQAEREVRRALKSDPDSPSLNSLLAVAQQKRDLLTTMLVHEQD